jgi:hypothetical protein
VIRCVSIVLAVTTLVVTAPVAMANDDLDDLIVEAEADAGASDARTVALDAAYASATRQAAKQLADPASVTSNRAAFDKEIIGRSRLWVASVAVISDNVVDGRRRLKVSVRIDSAKLSSRLQQLGIALASVVAEPVVAVTPAISITLLGRVVVPSETLATYGANATAKIPQFDELQQTFVKRGYRMRPAPASGPAANRERGLPLSDSQAQAFAGDAKADTAFVVGLHLSEPAPVRGERGDFVLGVARARWVQRDASRIPVAIDVIRTELAAASDAAALQQRLVHQISEAIVDKLPSADRSAPTMSSGEGVIVLQIARPVSASVVSALVKMLSTQAGVTRVDLTQVTAGGFVVSVATVQTAAKLATIVRRLTVQDRPMSADDKGSFVRIVVGKAPPSLPLTP